MNKNDQHYYKFFNDFPLLYNYENRPWTLKIWLGTLGYGASLVATVGDRRLHNSTNANAKTNILSMTAGCKEYIGSSQFIGSSLVVLQLSRRPPSRLGGDEIWSVDSQENR